MIASSENPAIPPSSRGAQNGFLVSAPDAQLGDISAIALVIGGAHGDLPATRACTALRMNILCSYQASTQGQLAGMA